MKTLLALLFLLSLSISVAQTYTSVVGIPDPAFGVTQTYRMYDTEGNRPGGLTYNVNAEGGYYTHWVEPSHASSTDTANTYGSPSTPRKTIPVTTLPAGAVVEMRGTYSTSHISGGGGKLQIAGSSTYPVFIRSLEGSEATITKPWEFINSSYVVIENMNFVLDASEANRGQLALQSPNERIVIRQNDFTANDNQGCIGVTTLSGGSGANQYCVIWDNGLHDSGDWYNYTATDDDLHGITVGQTANNLWIIENHMYYLEGDGCQINALSQANEALVHHIYVGRNHSHHNKQYGLWVKQSQDVIVSENHVHHLRPSNSSTGGGMGFQYSPARVWFLNNIIHDCEVGIRNSDNSAGTGTDCYIIGNLIYDCLFTGQGPDGHVYSASYPGDAFASAAISIVGGSSVSLVRHIYNNTMHNVEAGINSPGSGITFHIENNIISGIGAGNHSYLQQSNSASASDFGYNILEGTTKIRWAPQSQQTLTQFNASFPGKADGTLNSDPLFVNAGGGFYSLSSGSPARDAGASTAVAAALSEFESRYGISIAAGINGVIRPVGSWDIGAYEAVQLGGLTTGSLNITGTLNVGP